LLGLGLYLGLVLELGLRLGARLELELLLGLDQGLRVSVKNRVIDRDRVSVWFSARGRD
jgi:hypothetical protein